MPWLLGAAILFATVMGIGGLFEAQTGRWGPAGVDPERPAAVRPDVVAAPELAPATAQVQPAPASTPVTPGPVSLPNSTRAPFEAAGPLLVSVLDVIWPGVKARPSARLMSWSYW